MSEITYTLPDGEEVRAYTGNLLQHIINDLNHTKKMLQDIIEDIDRGLLYDIKHLQEVMLESGWVVEMVGDASLTSQRKHSGFLDVRVVPSAVKEGSNE